MEKEKFENLLKGFVEECVKNSNDSLLNPKWVFGLDLLIKKYRITIYNYFEELTYLPSYILESLQNIENFLNVDHNEIMSMDNKCEVVYMFLQNHINMVLFHCSIN